jgi:crotonobetainyl-CoA:carnitine CoA-transferase CaiB-like acyl-CoA transferase
MAKTTDIAPEDIAPGKPLHGLTIVELGHSVAAPYAGLILVELGARVIKVENPQGGDYARGWGPPFWGDVATAFLCLNRGKEGITVDYTRADDVRALRTLILEQADAVIQNLRPGILERFDLTPASLRAQRPDLIWCDIGAFGAHGPLSGKPGYDPLAQAATGIMSVTGEGGERPPVRVGVSLIDMGSGMWTVIGLLASLFDHRCCRYPVHRRRLVRKARRGRSSQLAAARRRSGGVPSANRSGWHAHGLRRRRALGRHSFDFRWDEAAFARACAEAW